MDHKIFISYSHADIDVAEQVANALAGAGLKAWLDKREGKPGESLVNKINTALEAASYMLLLVSKTSIASDWVKREWMSAMASQDTVLLPLLLDVSRPPALLRDLIHIDFSQNREAAIQELLAFFQRETEPATRLPSLHDDSAYLGRNWRGSREDDKDSDAAKPDFRPLRRASRRTIRLVARNCMDEADFQNFLFDAAIAPGRIRGDSLHQRLVNLLHLVATEGILEHFVDWLVLERQRCVVFQLSQLADQDFRIN